MEISLAKRVASPWKDSESTFPGGSEGRKSGGEDWRGACAIVEADANRFIESWSVYSNRFAGRSLPEKGGLG